MDKGDSEPSPSYLNLGAFTKQAEFPAAFEIMYLENLLHDENVFWFDVAMKDAIAVHVVHGCTPDPVISQQN